MKIFTKAFLKDTAERVINTFAQTLVATLTVAGLGAAGLNTISWTTALSVAGGAALLSLLKCVTVATTSSTSLDDTTAVEEVKDTPEVTQDLKFAIGSTDPKHRADSSPIG